MAKLLSSLPVGTLVKDAGTAYNGKPIVWQVMEHGHSGDPVGSTALLSQKIISLKCFDAIEASNSDSNRKQYGNNRYLYSNLLQWLNSDSAAGGWYKAKHSADAAPTNANVWSNNNEYDQEAGFLSNFSADLKAALLTVTKRTAKNTVTDGGGYEDVSSKIFLLSNTEVGLANENSVAEGFIYSLFSTSSNRVAYPTPEAVSKSEYKSSSLNSSSPWYWWLRSPYASNSYYARHVNTDGSLDGDGAYYCNSGVRPACAVPSSIHVSEKADTDGAYIIEWNQPPIISTESTELGDKNAPFDIKFSIADPDGDAVSAVVKLDGTEAQTIAEVVQGDTYTYTVTGSILNSLDDGEHKVTISATDSEENEGTFTIVFTKTTSPITLSGIDTDLGNVWIKPAYTYQVRNSDESTMFTVTEAVDGETVRKITDASYNEEITADFSWFDEISNEENHVYTITAEDENGAVAIRTLSFFKLGDEICFYTDSVDTDEAAEKIVFEMNYTTEGSPSVKVEVTNNANAAVPTWEDMTEDFLNHDFYNFKNKPEEGFGISVRVTINKSQETERIYVYSLGFSFY